MLTAFEITLRNDMPELSRFMESIAAFSREHRLPERVARSLALALHEHVANIIAYGHADHAPHLIVVRVRLEPEWVHAEVEDEGTPFNPLEYPEVDTTVPLDAKPLGGLGIQIMKKSMDALEYRRAGGRNILVMGKRIS